MACERDTYRTAEFLIDHAGSEAAIQTAYRGKKGRAVKGVVGVRVVAKFHPGGKSEL